MGKGNFTKKKPPYLLGILGIIPLAGALVGIGLIAYGIIKYKDKKLILIGFGALLFSIAAYSFAVYGSKLGKPGRSQFAKIAKLQLDNLVRSIESYKVQYGQYPGSLPEVKQDNPIVMIQDPLNHTEGTKADRFFHYSSQNSSYTLFSVGEDGIPDTTDDIFPSFHRSARSSNK